MALMTTEQMQRALSDDARAKRASNFHLRYEKHVKSADSVSQLHTTRVAHERLSEERQDELETQAICYVFYLLNELARAKLISGGPTYAPTEEALRRGKELHDSGYSPSEWLFKSSLELAMYSGPLL